MACDTTTTTIRLEAANVSWGQEEKTCITPAIGLTGGEYFKMSTPSIKYVVWTSVDSVGTEPVVAGYTNIEVAAPASYTVANWITAFITAIEAAGDILAVASTDGLSVSATNIYVGTVLETVTDEDTSFTLSADVVGFGGDLGKTKDAIEVSFEVSEFDVTANQTGESLLDKLITGNNANLSMNLLEMTEARWEQVVGNGYGDSVTPAGGTALYGMGTSKLNQSVFSYAGKLVLHPISSGDGVRTRDFTFWKTAPLPESINYDGTDSQAMSVTFNALIDENIDTAVNLFAFGDWAQDVRA